MERPRKRTASTSSRKRLPRQAGQVTSVSAKKTRWFRTVPMPSQTSHRPPGRLKEKAAASGRRAQEDGSSASISPYSANSFRMGVYRSVKVATLERFMRRAESCSTDTMRENCPQPRTIFSSPVCRSPPARREKTSVDFPEPEGPVTAVRQPVGKSTSRCFRL